MIEQKQLLANMIRCPDGTILESRGRHDYKEHTQEDGRVYIVDGGLAYSRVGGTDKAFEDLSVYVGDPHELIRERFTWGRNTDKRGILLPEIVLMKLKDLSNGHLENLCSFTSEGYPTFINQVFLDEWNYRIDEGIEVGDYE